MTLLIDEWTIINDDDLSIYEHGNKLHKQRNSIHEYLINNIMKYLCIKQYNLII